MIAPGHESREGQRDRAGSGRGDDGVAAAFKFADSLGERKGRSRSVQAIDDFIVETLVPVHIGFDTIVDNCGGPVDGRIDEAPLIARAGTAVHRSEEHTSELQSLMRISYAVFFLKKKT